MFTVERKDGSSLDTVDVLVCGNGQWGGLGNSVFSNAQGNPVRAKGVSGLLECESAGSGVILGPAGWLTTVINKFACFVLTSCR